MLRMLARAPGAKPCRASTSPRPAPRRASARSTSRSIACAARSSAIRPIRFSCRPFAASVTGWSYLHESPRHMTSLDIGLSHIRSAGFGCWGTAYGTSIGRMHQALRMPTGPLCPRAAHHHRADGDPAIGRGLRVHGAALADSVTLSKLSASAWSPNIAALIDVYQDGYPAGRAESMHDASRIAHGAARHGGRLPATATEMPPPGPEALLLAARSGALASRSAASSKQAVLDRHRRQVFESARNPGIQLDNAA